MWLLQIQAQTTDSSKFKSRKLTIDEINLVSSYYQQEGNNAAVTGGIGSQELSDFSNVIDVRLVTYDKKQRKHNIGAELGIDHYTSASSDRIDLKANSSASTADTRFYPSISWTRDNEKKGITTGAGLSYSGEYDYQSYGANFLLSVKSKDRSGELTAKLQVYLDEVTKITPVELRSGASTLNPTYEKASRNTFAASLSWSQIINKQFQLVILGDVIKQSGYLGLPFYRVYFNDGSVHQESLPGNRLKIPVSVRGSYFLGDKIILRAYYRFYTDNWGVTSNTASLEVPVKLTPFVSISPYYRYYDQSSAKYFNAYRQHTNVENYYTSNYDLSKFKSSFFGAGFRVAPPNGVLGISHVSMLELRYGHYTKNIDMSANVVSLNIRLK